MKWWDESWNPVVGCTPVSPACDNCYAARDAFRLARAGGKCSKYAGLTELSEVSPRTSPAEYRARYNGKIRSVNEDSPTWTQPTRWHRPRTIFVCNMSDLFHSGTPVPAIRRVFESIIMEDRHLFLLCTKRIGRALQFIQDAKIGLHGQIIGEQLAVHRRIPNAWIGATVEDGRWAAVRLPGLRELAPFFGGAFVSYEPALGPVDWESHVGPAVDDVRLVDAGGIRTREHWLSWIVAGGESGAHARPSHPDWIRWTREFCKSSEVRFTFKQWGRWMPADVRGDTAAMWEDGEMPLNADGTDCRGVESLVCQDTELMQAVGKNTAGRVLDGEVHEWVPSVEGVLG